MAMLATDYLDDTTRRLPQKTAFVDAKRSVSFSLLREEALKVSLALVGGGVFRSPVAVYMPKSASTVAAYMGILYSVNSIAPLDAKAPTKRTAKIIAALAPAAVITDREHEKDIAAVAGAAKIFVYEDMMSAPADETLALSRHELAIDADVAYIHFTSGSTGAPKGVVVNHRSVIDIAEWITDTFGIDENRVMGNEAPLHFSLSVQDIFACMRTGCTMYLMDASLFIFPAQLMLFLTEKNIDTMVFVPSVLVGIANSGILTELPSLPPFKNIFFCGGQMPVKQLKIWRNAFQNTKFVNLYAMTEITAMCAYYVVDRDFADGEPLPIGKACRNKEIILLGEDNKPVADGEVGEICVRGGCVGLGYYGDAARSAAAFVQNPLENNYCERLLRTGDLARKNERGELVYVSRKDFLIKHNGRRIELGEIEIVISAAANVDECCCIYDNIKSEIVLFYAGKATAKEILSEAREHLPRYMLPTRIIRIEKLPLNQNGKIDRLKLQKEL